MRKLDILEVFTMSLPTMIAKIRLKYHLNALDLYNSLNQLHLVSDEKAEELNKMHLKKCVDCYSRLGTILPKEFLDFAKD